MNNFLRRNVLPLLGIILAMSVGVSWLVRTSEGSAMFTDAVKPGTIIYFAGATCPLGYVPADGSALLRAGRYAFLFGAIGANWHTTADGTHFNVPALQNRFLRGAGSATDGNGGTAVALGAYQGDETAVNSLAVSSHTTGVSLSAAGGGTLYIGEQQVAATLSGSAQQLIGNNAAVTVSDPGHVHGMTGGTETRAKSYGVLVCIKY